MLRKDLAEFKKAIDEALELGTDRSRIEYARATPGQYDEIRTALDYVGKPNVVTPSAHRIYAGMREGKTAEQIASEVDLPVTYIRLLTGLQEGSLTIEAFQDAVKKAKDKKKSGKNSEKGNEPGKPAAGDGKKPGFTKKGQNGDEDEDSQSAAKGQKNGGKPGFLKGGLKNGEDGGKPDFLKGKNGEGDEAGEGPGDEEDADAESDDDGDEEGEVMELEPPDDKAVVNPELDDKQEPGKDTDKPVSDKPKVFSGPGKNDDTEKKMVIGKDQDHDDEVMNKAAGSGNEEEEDDDQAAGKKAKGKFDFLKKKKKKGQNDQNGQSEDEVSSNKGIKGQEPSAKEDGKPSKTNFLKKKKKKLGEAHLRPTSLLYKNKTTVQQDLEKIGFKRRPNRNWEHEHLDADYEGSASKGDVHKVLTRHGHVPSRAPDYYEYDRFPGGGGAQLTMGGGRVTGIRFNNRRRTD